MADYETVFHSRDQHIYNQLTSWFCRRSSCGLARWGAQGARRRLLAHPPKLRVSRFDLLDESTYLLVYGQGRLQEGERESYWFTNS
jgi:hypothetical protein